MRRSPCFHGITGAFAPRSVASSDLRHMRGSRPQKANSSSRGRVVPRLWVLWVALSLASPAASVSEAADQTQPVTTIYYRNDAGGRIQVRRFTLSGLNDFLLAEPSDPTSGGPAGIAEDTRLYPAACIYYSDQPTVNQPAGICRIRSAYTIPMQTPTHVDTPTSSDMAIGRVSSAPDAYKVFYAYLAIHGGVLHDIYDIRVFDPDPNTSTPIQIIWGGNESQEGPIALAVSEPADPSQGLVYYAVAGEIYATGYDGLPAQSPAIVDARPHDIYKLAIDNVNHKLYWLEYDYFATPALSTTLRRANLDGTGSELIYTGSNILDMDVDPQGQKIYFSWQSDDPGTNPWGIYTIPMNATGSPTMLSLGQVGVEPGFDIPVPSEFALGRRIPSIHVTSHTAGHGLIHPLGEGLYYSGDAQLYTFAADTGYKVQDVLIDGSSVGAVTSYLFTDLSADHTVDVGFTPNSTGVSGATRPNTLWLGPAAPNPLRSSAELRFGLRRAASVSLTILDASGRLVRSLIDERLEPGEHTMQWNGCDNAGRPVPSGLYFYRVVADGAVRTRRLVALR